jgi:hypothetical protein
LLSVSVGRARALGRGGNVTEVYYPSLPRHEVRGGSVIVNVFIDLPYGTKEYAVPVLAPELVDARRVLEGALAKVLGRAGWDEPHDVSFELLPVELQVALKRVAEAVVAVATNVLSREMKLPYVGSLLVACDPRAARASYRVFYDSGAYHIYHVGYTCKSHAGDAELRLWVHRTSDIMLLEVKLDTQTR